MSRSLSIGSVFGFAPSVDMALSSSASAATAPAAASAARRTEWRCRPWPRRTTLQACKNNGVALLEPLPDFRVDSVAAASSNLARHDLRVPVLFLHDIDGRSARTYLHSFRWNEKHIRPGSRLYGDACRHIRLQLMPLVV